MSFPTRTHSLLSSSWVKDVAISSLRFPCKPFAALSVRFMWWRMWSYSVLPGTEHVPVETLSTQLSALIETGDISCLNLWAIDDLKRKLLSATIELESLKAEAKEETRKHNEDMKQLLNLVKIAYQERDEAKNQLQKLLNKLMFCGNKAVAHESLHSIVLQPQPESPSPLVLPTKANSSITESNSLDTYNQQSHASSPANSFFDAVSSPDFSSINMADSSQMGLVNKALVQDFNNSLQAGLVCQASAKIDPADAVLENLIKGKVLPQKGNLLQTVMEAGPLLQTLLVAGPLPRWRNPPPLKPFKIPPVLINGSDTVNITSHKLAANVQSSSQRALNSSSYLEMCRGSSQMCSASMLNFTNSSSGSCLGNRWLLNSGAINQIPAGKRQRL